MRLSASNLSSIRREFLDWDRPALPEAARRLAQRYRQGGTLDLQNVIVVVPGQRAGRRLRELLAFLAEDEHLRLTPPKVVTEGRLPELLYTPKFPFASDLVQDLAWAKALRALPAETRRHVVPHPPAASETVGWLELGKVLRKLHVELAADGLDFAAVHKKGPQVTGFTEGLRWAALVEVQQQYHKTLDEQELWDIQSARLVAIQKHEPRTDCDIVLLGAVDLNEALRQMLDQVAERVTAHIVAPEQFADRFDAHGCLVPGAWSDAALPLKDEQLRQVDGPVEQAITVMDWLTELNGRYQTDEVVIGVPDQTLVPQLQRQLEQSAVQARWVEGARLAETGPYRLLAAAVRFAGQRRYEDLAALLRHPDCEDWQEAKSLPAQLDLYYNTHLPSRIASGQALHQNDEWPDLTAAVEHIDNWLATASANHRLREWGKIFADVLGAIYGNRTLRLEEPADEALHKTILKILDVCNTLGELPAALDTAALSAADAFQIALGPLGKESLPPVADVNAVEILGWLELPLDDARALIVTSFNEGLVPQSTTADAFLPDRLRKELGLEHNERRYARDAYAVSVLCHSREELRVLMARRDAENTPLHPSRLVFACDDATLIRRSRQFFGGHTITSAPRRLLLPDAGLAKSLFEVPPPVKPTYKLERISVTRFKTYLACPYRYYLRHVRKLEVVDDAARELDGAAFGTLVHGALSAFGRDPTAPRHSTKADDVFAFLAEQLQTMAQERYGSAEHRAAIRLQLEQARRRLKVFAAQQALLVQEGWRIVHAEAADAANGDLSVPFAFNGDAVTLIGRIDRIDYHEGSRTLRILDYKTADNAQKPDKTHRKGEAWIDLQLPLYRHLCQTDQLKLPKSNTLELGYFNLPKRVEETEVAVAEWDGPTLASADAKAREVVGSIHKGIFWPPTHPAPDYFDDLAAICLDTALSGPPLLDVDSEGEGEGEQGGSA